MKKSDNFDPLYGPPPGASQEDLKKFTDLLIEKYKNSIVEIYIGDQFSSLNYEDHSIQQNATIFGRLIDILDRFLILDCFYVDPRSGEVRSGNLVLVNSFQIRAMTDINEDNGSLDDVFLNARSVVKIKKYLHIQSKHSKAK